ncbi:hypothetical protein [Microcoleus sp. B7-D4]|jgi:hypothetical protein|uniref:hypothetical protein n=1 Tax=Microcoleus sp. B7-D4 TaxID=2818696 RepID=UPI002FD5C9AE
MPTENHQDYDQLLESSSATIDNQRKVVALLQSRLREEREKFEAQLAELQKRLDAAEKNSDSAIEPDPYIFLNWLKDLVKGKSRKPPQWEPTKAEAEAILARVRQS